MKIMKIMEMPFICRQVYGKPYTESFGHILYQCMNENNNKKEILSPTLMTDLKYGD